MKYAKSTIKVEEKIKFPVKVIQSDIDDGECRVAEKCMQKIAIARSLTSIFRLKEDEQRKLHVRVDAGHISFNLRGYHYIADTPTIAKRALIAFDQELRVKPHNYTVTATKKKKVVVITKERQKQINIARRKRAEEGRPDRDYSSRVTLRHRIVGYDTKDVR